MEAQLHKYKHKPTNWRESDRLNEMKQNEEELIPRK